VRSDVFESGRAVVVGAKGYRAEGRRDVGAGVAFVQVLVEGVA